MGLDCGLAVSTLTHPPGRAIYFQISKWERSPSEAQSSALRCWDSQKEPERIWGPWLIVECCCSSVASVSLKASLPPLLLFILCEVTGQHWVTIACQALYMADEYDQVSQRSREDQRATCPRSSWIGLPATPGSVCRLLGFAFLSQLDGGAMVIRKAELPLSALKAAFDVISQWLCAAIIAHAGKRPMAYSCQLCAKLSKTRIMRMILLCMAVISHLLSLLCCPPKYAKQK